jgi:hypothetical protein
VLNAPGIVYPNLLLRVNRIPVGVWGKMQDDFVLSAKK